MSGSPTAILQPLPDGGTAPVSPFRGNRPPTAKLRINVLFTDSPSSDAALRRAGRLATDLQADIQMIAPHVVPYPLDLDHPAVPLSFTSTSLLNLSRSACVEALITVYPCRDVPDLLKKILPAGSIVVIGMRRRLRFWRSGNRIVRSLRDRGCQVVAAWY